MREHDHNALGRSIQITRRQRFTPGSRAVAVASGRLDSALAGAGFVLVAALCWLIASPCSAQLTDLHYNDMPQVDTAGPLSPEQEREVAERVAHLRQVWDSAPPPVHHRVVSQNIGAGRTRDMQTARFHLNRHSDPTTDRSLEDDPLAWDDSRDVLLSTFVKLQRESFERALGLSDWIDARETRRDAKKAARSAEGRSYRMRFSPQASDEKAGVKISMPYTGVRFFDSLSFRSRYVFDDGVVAHDLKFDDGERFYFLSYSPSTEDDGELMTLSLRYWF